MLKLLVKEMQLLLSAVCSKAHDVEIDRLYDSTLLVNFLGQTNNSGTSYFLVPVKLMNYLIKSLTKNEVLSALAVRTLLFSLENSRTNLSF